MKIWETFWGFRVKDLKKRFLGNWKIDLKDIKSTDLETIQKRIDSAESDLSRNDISGEDQSN